MGQYMKKAVKVEPDGLRALYLDCVCGEKVPLPQINGLPTAAYVCGKCGREYDGRGWILTGPEVVRVIVGDAGGPNGKWEEVQAVQHAPFIFIMYCGHTAENENIPKLLEMLRTYRLREDYRNGNCASLNPCRGVVNPEWNWENLVPHYIDGPRLYACDNVWRFSGNFENYSFAFGIDTNHKPTIAALLAAIAENETVQS